MPAKTKLLSLLPLLSSVSDVVFSTSPLSSILSVGSLIGAKSRSEVKHFREAQLVKSWRRLGRSAWPDRNGHSRMRLRSLIPLQLALTGVP